MEKKKFILRTGIVGVIAVLLIAIILGVKISNSKLLELDEEMRRSMTYDKVKPNENNTQSDYVKFDAFFLKKQAGTNKAEGVRGTCKRVGEEDTLYMELNVLTNGHLENAKITINGDKNYYLQTAIVKDEQISQNYLQADAREIVFNKVIKNGTQKLITGVVRSGDYSYSSRKMAALENNINNYSKINSVTLTGTFVPDEQNAQTVEINKTVEFKVDWYGETKAELYQLRQKKDIKNMIDEEKQEINLEFTIMPREVNNNLLLSKSYIEGTIPQLNGYNPTKVEITGTNVASSYSPNTRKFVATREAIIKNGKITTSAYVGEMGSTRYNEYKLKVTYPLEAYEKLGIDTIDYKLPVNAYYEGYNNINSEFKNPYKSNIAQGTYVITFRKAEGNKAGFSVRVGDYAHTPYWRYMVSKRKPLNIYNGISLEEIDDTYLVRWEAYTGTAGSIGKMIMKETEGEGAKTSDKFIKTNSAEESMEDVTSFIGIYFSDPTSLLGEDGKIEVYNDDTNELIETFTKNNWNRYSESNPYRYEVPVKHIRIETSDVNGDSYLTVYHVKELDDNKITNKYTKEEFHNLEHIKANLTGYINGDKFHTDIHTAYYEEPISVARVDLSKTALSTQETEKNMQIQINTEAYTNYNEEKWTNGAFLLKLPKSIIGLEINSVNIDNKEVEIINYETYEDDGNIFIKINTENENPEMYKITINCNITPDPRIPTKEGEKIELYAHNEYNPNYYYKAEDMYDVNDNGNVIEDVNKIDTTINLISPNSLLTSQTATEYDEKGSITVAPQIAPVSKEQRQAKITINVTNNYEGTIGKVKLIGKIPFRGNTYVINKGDMGSNFDTKITNEGIILPAKLQGKAVVYYSEKENPDVNNPSDWTRSLDVSKVKTFLIDFGNNKLARGETHNISYRINIPQGINYNQISYSHHAVYFTLDTKEGEYDTQTEPNKLGFRIAKKYDLELTKYQKDTDKLVEGATYSFKEEGEEIAKTKTTNKDGKLILKNLYIDKIYEIKEIKSPSEYELNEDVIKIKGVEENGKLAVKKVSGEVKKIEKVEQENKVSIQVEDEIKANLKITKQEKTKEGEQANKLANIRYKLTGKGMQNNGRIYVTNKQGEIEVKGLYIGEKYILEEIKAEGYYIEDKIEIIITKNGANFVKNIEGAGKNVVVDSEIAVTDYKPTLNMTLENEKIPTYNLVINKVEKDKEVPVQGAKFRLYKGETAQEEYETDEQGKIEIKGLYQYKQERRNVDQTYTLKETYSPDGYAKVEDITFYAETIEGVLNMHTNSKEVRKTEVNGDTITITVEDSPTFKLTKIDGETKKVLSGVKFAIYDYKTGKPATDAKGQIIGTKERINGKTYYTVQTDKNGEITANLPQGLYKAVEVQTLEEYELATDEMEITKYFGIGENKAEVRKWQSILGASIGGTGNEKINAIAETSDGGIVVGGYFDSDRIELENGQVLVSKRLC